MTAPARAQQVCECGCGRQASVGRRFLHGHGSRRTNPRGRWKGGVYTTQKGYRMYRDSPTAPRKFEHVLIAERALGRPLPKGAEVHHVNENRADNSRGNLVLCQDHSYHMRIQRRTRAMAACGKPSWLRCRFCKKYDAPENLRVYREGPRNHVRAYHRACATHRSHRGKAA